MEEANKIAMYNDLQSSIMEDICKYLDAELKAIRAKFINSKVRDGDIPSLRPIDSNIVVTHLTEEVKFLREELRCRREELSRKEASFQKIINILSDDRNSAKNFKTTVGERENKWEIPTKTFRNRNNNSIPKLVEVSNRFELLSENNERSNQNVSENEESNCERMNDVLSIPSNNITMRKKGRSSKKTIAVGNISSNVAENIKVRDSATKKPKKSVIILGDSTTKDLKGWLMRKTHHVTTHSLSGCTLKEIPHLCRALCERNPAILIVACGTNSLFSKFNDSQDDSLSEEEVIAELRKLFLTLGTEYPGTKVIFSSLLVRTDKGKEGIEKIKRVNSLIQSCNMPHISHNNITERHLNGSKLHLNKQGSSILAKNYVDFLELYDEN